MWTTRVASEAEVAPEAVWSVLVDVAGWSQWNDGVASISLDGPVAVGCGFEMAMPDGASVHSTVVALVAGELLTDRTVLEGVRVDVAHRITPTATRCEVAFEASVDAVVPGSVPEEVLAEIGEGVTADFPEVIEALLDRAGRREGDR